MSSDERSALPPVPKELIDAGARGQLVVLVGSGASKNSGLPDWKELLNKLFDQARQDPLEPSRREEWDKLEAWYTHPDQKDLLRKASALARFKGDPWLAGAVTRELRNATAIASEVHKALAEVPGTAFITTNYDSLLEQALEARINQATKVILLSDIEGIRDFSPGQVLKLHGDLDYPDTIVLKTSDYFRVSHRDPQAWRKRLEASLQPPSQVLLVGYSYSDIDIQDVIDTLRGAYEAKLPGPFWVTREDYDSELKASEYGLRLVGLKDFGQLAPWIRKLAQEIKLRQEQAPALMRVYRTKLHEHFKEEQGRANKLFEEHRYEDAYQAFLTLASHVTMLAGAAPEDAELRKLEAGCRLNIACCLVCLLKDEEALSILKEVALKADLLSADGRATLSEGLAQMGEPGLARQVLPSDNLNPHVKAASQLIDVLQGRLPTDERAPSIILSLQIARLLLKQGRLDEASQECIGQIETNQGDPLPLLLLTTYLVQALRRSVLEDSDAAQWVPPEKRGRLVDTIESAFNQLDNLLQVPAQRSLLEQFRALFYDLTQDHERFDLAGRSLQALGATLGEIFNNESSAEIKDIEQAFSLARGGKLEEALSFLQPSKHPWLQSVVRVQLYRLSNRPEEALQQALLAAELWPRRAPLEFHVAELLLRASRLGEALGHAQAAFHALPGRGFRRLLARCFFAIGDINGAWEQLELLKDSRDPLVLKLRASTAEQVAPDQALNLWDLYLTQQPDDIEIKLHVPGLLFQLGKTDEAAQRAWSLFEEYQEQLDSKQVYECAQLQRLGGYLDEEVRERMMQAVKVLETRFPGVHEAEQYRLHLLTALGFPDEAKPFDFDALAAAGALQRVTLDEAREFFHQRKSTVDAAYNDYLNGQLSFESFSKLTNRPAAEYFVRILRMASTRHGIPVLCTPVAYGIEVPAPNLRGQQLLVGELELLVLQHLGLFGKLRNAMGKDGRLRLFHGVWDAVVQAASDLELRTQRVSLEQHEKLIQVLEESHKVSYGEDHDHSDDRAWAKQHGLPIVDTDSTQDDSLSTKFSCRSLVLRVAELGLVTREVRDKLLRQFPGPESSAQLADPLPVCFAITYPPLLILSEAGALVSLLDIVPEKIVVGARTMEQLRNRRGELREDIEAAELAAALHRTVAAGITEGWVQYIDRPNIPELPQPRATQESWNEGLIREHLASALTFRQALSGEPNLWLLAADFSFIAPLGSNPLIAKLAWTPPAREFYELASRMRHLSERAIHFPALVRQLLPKPEAWKALERLAKLGFVDALRAEDLVELARRYGGLDKSEPSRLLDRIEWMARRREHPGSSAANLRLATVYSAAIWEVFCGDSTDADSHSIATALLARADSIDLEMHGSLLSMLLVFVCIAAIDRPKTSFVRDGGKLKLSLDSKTGRLWSFLRDWAGTEGRRQGSFYHSLRESWAQLDALDISDTSKRNRCYPLVLAAMGKSLTLQNPSIEAAAILSANWENEARPFADLEIEQELQDWAQRLGNLEEPYYLGADHLVYDLPTTQKGRIAAAAPESVLLRASAEAIGEWAVHLARLQGPHDGRAHKYLIELSRDPKNPQLRRDYARMTVTAPWRLVREDPASIRAWGWRRRYGENYFPNDLDDLRELLSEPKGLLGDRPFNVLLEDRLSENGFWGSREDQISLCLRASKVPGLLAAYSVPLRMMAPDAVYAEDVAEALNRLRHPNDYPSAHLACDILFLRVAARQRPYIRLQQGETDLREELLIFLPAVLRSAVKPSSSSASALGVDSERSASHDEDSFAAAEAGILRLCGQVVRDLAGLVPLPLKDGLWLTYRLFGWLWAQLETLSPDARISGLRRLRQISPTPNQFAVGEGDLLDPFRFDPKRFDYRLATLLYALCLMEVLRPAGSSEGEENKEEARKVTSTALEDLLVEIASRPISDEDRLFRARHPTPSRLAWEESGALPDLALKALLHINDEAYFRVSPERRLQWLFDLPKSVNQKEKANWQLAFRILVALTDHTQRLTPEEKTAFEEHLRSLDDVFEDASFIRWFGLTQLYGAGRQHLESEVQKLLIENLKHPRAPDAFGRYLTALSNIAPDRLEAEIERILALVESSGQEPVPFAAGLGRVVILGNPNTISTTKRFLRKLSERPPFSGDERMRSLLGTLGMLSSS